MKGFLRIAHKNNFIVILCMAIMFSPLFFVMNSYAEGNGVASASTVRKVNVASGSDTSFDDEEIDEDEEDDSTDYLEEPEEDSEENSASGDIENFGSGESSNLGSGTGNFESGDGNIGDNSDGEPQNDSSTATSSDADEITNESEPEEQTSNTNNNATRSTPSNIVSKLGLAPSVPFVPLGAPVSVGTWGSIPCMYDSSTNTLTLTGGTGLITGAGVSGASGCFGSGSLYMAIADASITIGGVTGTGTLSKADINGIKKVEFVGGTDKVIFDSAGGSLKQMFIDDNSIPEGAWKALEKVDFSGADFSNISSMDRSFSGDKSLKVVIFPSVSFGSSITTVEYCFNQCNSLTTITNLDKFNTSSVTTMNSFFSGCESLASINLSNFITDNVTDMTQMFTGCKNIETLDLSSFNTNQVNTMKNMFNGCTKLTSISYGSNWNTANVTDMSQMFCETLSMQTIDVSKYNFASCTTMENMFRMANYSFSVKNNSKLEKVILPTSTSFSTVANMGMAFCGCTELVSVENANKLNTAGTTNYAALFLGCEKLKEIDLTNLNISSSTSSSNLQLMFGGYTYGSVTYNAAPITKITLGANFDLPTGTDIGLLDKAWGGSDSTTYTDTASMLTAHASKNITVTYIDPSAPTPIPTPTPAPPSGGGGSSGGGGGGGGTIDPSGKPLDPQIIGPGITSDPSSDPFADPFANGFDINIGSIVIFNPDGIDPLINNPIPPTEVPEETILPINYEESTTTKVEVIKKPIIVRSSSGGGSSGSGGGSDNAKLSLIDMTGNSYNATYGFYDVEVKNVNADQKGTIDTYYVNESSNLVTGWIETANKKRYFMEPAKNQDEGKMCHGWKRIVSDWYFFDYDGSMMKGRKTPDGFVVDGEGKMTNPTFLDRALINGKQNRTVYTMEKIYRHD